MPRPASRDKMSTISSDNEDTILLPRQTPKPTMPYPIALSHDFEWDQEHGYSPSVKTVAPVIIMIIVC